MKHRHWRIATLGLLVATLAVGLVERVIHGPIELPAVPVHVSFRNSALGHGLVAKFRNTSDRDLRIHAVFTNHPRQEKQEVTLAIRSQATVEWGWGEGWTFVHGETITIRLPGHRDRVVDVP